MAPWDPADASKHTHLADTPRRQRMFADIANKELASSGNEGEAIRMANAAVHRDHEKHGRKEPANGSHHWSGAK